MYKLLGSVIYDKNTGEYKYLKVRGDGVIVEKDDFGNEYTIEDVKGENEY